MKLKSEEGDLGHSEPIIMILNISKGLSLQEELMCLELRDKQGEE